MGAAAGGAKGGYQRRNSRRRSSSAGVMADINVTPLVDVMLVLLIVFMVAAPLMTVGVPVELPKTSANPMPTSNEPVYVTVQADKSLYLKESPIQLADLITQLQATTKNGTEEQIMLRADTTVDYGAVMEVMGVLSAAGYKKIGLLTGTLPTPAGGG